MVDNIKFAKDGVVVYIDTTIIEETFINAIKSNTVPSTDENYNVTMLLNLNKFEDRFTIDGYLSEGNSGVGETSSVAKDKKANFRTLFIAGTVVTMTYDGADYDLGIEKASIKDMINDGVDNDDVARYSVKITAIVGGDII